MGQMIGIDLGTTNSVVAFLKGAPELINIKGRPWLPSVVAYDGGGFLVGHAAKNLAATSEEVIVSPKRNMGTEHKYQMAGRTFTPVNASAMILKEIKKHAEEFLGDTVDMAVITIPAYFNTQQVDDTRKAAEEAGLKVGKLLAEPVAASATYGSGGEDMILVFDFGGGTLDCTVVDTFDAKIMGLSGDNWLGGDDFDRRIVDRMVKLLKEQSGLDVSTCPKSLVKLKQKAEEAKINLSDAMSTQVEFVGKLEGKLCQVEFLLTRDEYNRMIDDLVTRSIEKADEAIERAGMTKDDIDVVLLVGGSTLTPHVQQRLAKHFGKAPSKRVDPMLAVGLGAAICTRDVPWDDKSHRIILRSRAQVWPKPSYTVRGKTSKGSKIEITGGGATVRGATTGEGDFAVDLPLAPNQINEVTIAATSPKGEVAKSMLSIRQDASPQVKAEEPAPPPVIAATLPRTIMIGFATTINGVPKSDYVASEVRAGTEVPHCYEDSKNFHIVASPTPRAVTIPVYEGNLPEHEIPFGPFNTHLGDLVIQCPPLNHNADVVVAFEIDESRNLTFSCWFKDDPSVRAAITLHPQSLARDRWHLIERVDTTINQGGDRIRPDERARVNQKKQVILDLCEQYAARPEGSSEAESVRDRIIATGTELKNEIAALERKYGL